MVQALIESWNTDIKAFKLGWREVPFSYFDAALLTGLPASGGPVVFEQTEVPGRFNRY